MHTDTISVSCTHNLDRNITVQLVCTVLLYSRTMRLHPAGVCTSEKKPVLVRTPLECCWIATTDIKNEGKAMRRKRHDTLAG